MVQQPQKTSYSVKGNTWLIPNKKVNMTTFKDMYPAEG